MAISSFTSTAPSVHITHPPYSLFKIRLNPDLEALSPPKSDFTFARPFNISPALYSGALHPAVPITIAVMYAVTAIYGSRINKERGMKPWAFHETKTFRFLVLFHNVLLAVFSAWVSLGMLNALRRSWPGLNGDHGLAGAADALCKMNGPRGLGSAATFDEELGSWGFTDRTMKLNGLIPDSTDVGRLWNEGLAYYGWIFYISKLYEVMDTAIVLIKGKKSSNLQTFHHTGAMLAMWAGIRYMSPPIWMFALINSTIHTLMYTYYTLTTLTISVPARFKPTLTALQIAQIVLGTSYALAHLFIAYDIPIEKPYLFAHNLSTVLPSAASTVSTAIASAMTSAAASAGVGDWLKKAALRAAGEEGLAENVRNRQGETFGIDARHAAEVEKAQQAVKYRWSTQRIHCLDTSGQVFAICLNVIYLIPLVILFIRFYSRSYTKRAHREPPKPTIPENIKASAKDAITNMEDQIEEAMSVNQGGTTELPPKTKTKLEQAKQTAKDKGQDLSDKAQIHAKEAGAKAQQAANDLGTKAKDITGDLPTKAQSGAQDLTNRAKDAAGNVPEKAQKSLEETKKYVKDDLATLMKKMGGDNPKKAKQTPNGAGKDSSKPRDPSPTKLPQPKKGEKKDEKDEKDGKDEKKDRKDDGQKDENKTENNDEKKDEKKDGKKDEAKKEEDGNEKEDTNGDASAYEMVPDEPKSEDMKKAEEKMQPDQ